MGRQMWARHEVREDCIRCVHVRDTSASTLPFSTAPSMTGSSKKAGEFIEEVMVMVVVVVVVDERWGWRGGRERGRRGGSCVLRSRPLQKGH